MKARKIAAGIIIGTMALNAYAAEMSDVRKQELCQKSDKKIWAFNDSVCVPLDACNQLKDTYKSYCIDALMTELYMDFKTAHCITEFKELLNTYAKNILNAPNGCDNIKMANIGGFSYAGCSFNGDVRVFRMGLNNTVPCNEMFTPRLWCMVFGGTYSAGMERDAHNALYTTDLSCKNITAEQCAKLSGNYDAASRNCVIRSIK